jgi:hypothetical protein
MMTTRAIVSSALATIGKKTWLPVALTVGALGAVATPTSAQMTPHGPLDQISAKPQVIRAQIELGGKLADQAITILETSDDPDQLEKAKEFVKRSYEMLRFANTGCEIRKGDANLIEARFLSMAMDNINAARQRNITAGIAINNSIPWPESRAQYMSEALDLLRPVPALAQRAAPLIR